MINKPKLLQKSKFFFKHLNYLFFNQKIMLSKVSLNIFNKTIFLNAHVYFLVSLEKGDQINYLNKVNNKINNFIIKQFSLFDVNNIKLKIFNLNKKIKRNKVKEIYLKFKKFERMIFLQRTDLFLNFLNICYLVLVKKISINCYLILLSKLFVRLTKREHSKFFIFLKFLINWSLDNKIVKKIRGIKFIINGRLKGKPRSSSFKFIKGNVPCQSIISNIKYSHMHAYNRYGAFGLKLWINY